MNYKLNQLNTKLECSELMCNELPIMMGSISDELRVFDADYYCAERGIEAEDWTVFTRIHKFYIERIAKMSDKQTSEMFYRNTDGHLLMDEQLVFLYIMYRDEIAMSYLFSMLSDVLTEGIALSDSYLYSTVSSRFPREFVDKAFSGYSSEEENKTEEKNGENEESGTRDVSQA